MWSAVLTGGADWADPWLSDGSLAATAAFGFNGSQKATVVFRAPGLWKDWRLFAEGYWVKDSRLGYFGVGHDSPYDAALEDGNSNYYRVRRGRLGGRVEVTRRLVGHLEAAVAAGIVGTEFTDLPAPTLFGAEVGRELDETDYTASLRLVFDTRNREYNPATGALLQAGALVGNAYGRYHGDFRGFVSPFYSTVVAGRLTAVTTAGTPSVALDRFQHRLERLAGELGTLFRQPLREARPHVLHGDEYDGADVAPRIRFAEAAAHRGARDMLDWREISIRQIDGEVAVTITPSARG